MLRVKFIIISSFFLFLSCAKRAPEGILSEKKMSELLTEVAMIDGYLNTLMIDSAKKVMPVLYENAFKKFDIDSTQFKQNLTYYLGNPPLAEKVYGQVTVKLQGMERQYYKEDSIRNVFVQDSVSRAYRLQANAIRMRNALLSHHKDTLSYNYYDNSIYFKELVPLKINPIELRRKQDVLGEAPKPTSNPSANHVVKQGEEVMNVEQPTPVEEVVPQAQLKRETPQRLRNSTKPRKLEVLEGGATN